MTIPLSNFFYPLDILAYSVAVLSGFNSLLSVQLPDLQTYYMVLSNFFISKSGFTPPRVILKHFVFV